MIIGTASVETKLKRHGLSAAFMDPPDKELDRMAEDIRDHGLIEPIVTVEENGETFVLDGWGRYKCCLKAGVEPRFADFDELKTGVTKTEFVMSRNMFRKHLTPTQRACIAADVYNGKFLNKGHVAHKHPELVSVQTAAKMARVNEQTLRGAIRAKHVDPELFAKMKTGEVRNAAKMYRENPKLRVQKPSVFSPSLAASRALSPMLVGVRDLADNLKLKPAEFAKNWSIWEPGAADKAKKLAAMKRAHQWLGEVLAILEPK